MPIPFEPKHRSHVSASRFTRAVLIARLKRLQRRKKALCPKRARKVSEEDA